MTKNSSEPLWFKRIVFAYIGYLAFFVLAAIVGWFMTENELVFLGVFAAGLLIVLFASANRMGPPDGYEPDPRKE